MKYNFLVANLFITLEGPGGLSIIEWAGIGQPWGDQGRGYHVTFYIHVRD